MSGTVRLRIALIAGAALALAALGACFSEEGDTTGPGPNPLAACNVPFDAIQNGNTILAIRNFAFFPDSIAVPVGTTVTWVNCEDAGVEPHTTTSDTGVWGSNDLSPGDSFSFTFDDPGVFTYHCVPHIEFMFGFKIVVQ